MSENTSLSGLVAETKLALASHASDGIYLPGPKSWDDACGLRRYREWVVGPATQIVDNYDGGSIEMEEILRSWHTFYCQWVTDNC